MKNILIFEGIASSGKTTLEKLMIERLPGAVLVSENDTLMPVIDNRDGKRASKEAWMKKSSITAKDWEAYTDEMMERWEKGFLRGLARKRFGC